MNVQYCQPYFFCCRQYYTPIMKKVFTTLLLTISLASFGQRSKYNTFKLIVLKPDTAIIDKELFSDIDSVQSDYLKRYYYSVQQMEKLVNSKNFQDDSSYKATLEKMRIELMAAKAAEPEIKKFKYYQTLSAYSAEVYSFYFNEYEPLSTIIELPNQSTELQSVKKLANTSKADYVVFFSNVHTDLKDGMPILKLTTSLYSKKDNKIILTKETEGDTTSRGDMWTCGSTILSCLFINGVRTSTDLVAPEIAKRQIRH
jgi:hypothetical protein